MGKIRHKSFITLGVVLAAFILITAHSITSHAKLRFNHTVTVENNTELYVLIDVWECEAGGGWRGFAVPPVSIRSKQFQLPPGCKNIEVRPDRCGNFKNFPIKVFQTQVSGTNLNTNIVLTDRVFGKSVILPQCPERMGNGGGGCPQIITAKDFLGVWSHKSWGDMNLKPSGSSVSGSYGYQNGQINNTRIEGRTLKGQWHEKAQGDATKGPGDWGYFEFTLTGNCKSIDGKWKYSNQTNWREDWDLNFKHK